MSSGQDIAAKPHIVGGRDLVISRRPSTSGPFLAQWDYVTESAWWAPEPAVEPPRTLAWSMGHLGAGSLIRADWLVGEHEMDTGPEWPMTAEAATEFLRLGLDAWRSGLNQMDDTDLDTVGRSAYPGGLDPELPLLDIVWWVNKELLWHAAEIWYTRDMYAALHPV